MKLRFMRDYALPLVETTARAIKARSTLPILANILIEADDAHVSFVATDLEITIGTKLSAQVKAGGRVTVDGKALVAFLKGAPKGCVVELDAKDETVTLKAGNLTRTIRGIDAEEYPAAVTDTGKATGTRVGAQALQRALSETVFAAAGDDARPILVSVLFGFQKGNDNFGLTLAAADNYRISTQTIPTIDKVKPLSILVPVRAVEELIRILPKGGDLDAVTIYPEPAKNRVLFSIGDTRLISRLIDGHYPNYEQVMPRTWSTRFLVDAKALAVTAKQVAEVSPLNYVRLSPQSNGKLLLSANDNDGGSMSAELPITFDDLGEVTYIDLNASYLADLPKVATGSVMVGLNGRLSPATFTPADQYDSAAIYVVMPVRVTS